MVSLDFTDRDVFSFYRQEDRMEMVVLFVRSGRLGGSRSFTLRNLQLADEDVLCSFLAQYYDQGKFIPREIITPLHLKDTGLLQEWLDETSGHPVSIVSVTRGPRSELLRMAAQNAEILFHRQTAREQQAHEDILAGLQEKLSLNNFPACIECFDISNLSGTSAVGAAVRFEQGEPHKDGYRRFRIKTVQQADDYAMMYEVLSRHLARARTGDRLPDLIMVDGGKGQLGVLLRALQDAGMSAVDAISLAKGRASRNSRVEDFAAEEKIFLPHRKGPLILPQRSAGLLLLQRIRDEAHRFAITYHQKLKAKHDLSSPLEGIPGIGKSTARRILRHFGTMEQIRNASQQQLETLPFLNKKRAALIYDYFHTRTEGAPERGNQ
jgi:excinuclease ABC subunit C